MHVLLIIAPPASTHHPLLGVASIVSVTTMKDHSVTVCDINLAAYLDGRIDKAFWERDNVDIWYDDVFFKKTWPVVENILTTEIFANDKLGCFDVIGMHVNYASLRMASSVAVIIKKHFPNLPIALGGPQFFMPIEYDIPWADVVFCGEAELSWQHWLENGCSQRGIVDTLQIDMNSLPIPDFSFFPKGYQREATLPVETSRGCVNRCAFCMDAQMWGRFRMKSPQHLAMDLASIRAYGAHHVNCMDSVVNSSASRLLDILPVFEASGLSWEGMFQVRGITDDVAVRLRDASCSHVFLGVESFSPTLLHHLNKSHVSEGAVLAIRALGSVGIPVTIGLIVAGYPFQSQSEFVADTDTIMALAPYLHSVAINPLCIPKDTPLQIIASALGVQGVETLNGWKLWHCGDKQGDVYRRYEWCCIAIEKLRSVGIHTTGISNLAQFFELGDGVDSRDSL
jgi:anaerobic magnesium-protoporphyrin IX monomethyl ester cyclase